MSVENSVFSTSVGALLLAGGCTLQPCPEEVPDALTPGIFLEEPERVTSAIAIPLRPVSADGISLTKVSEGFRARLYHDVARFCTIGYGHLVKKAPCDGTEPASFRRGLSEPEGGSLLGIDMNGAQRVVQMAVKIELTDAQFGALCDFVFNVGPTNFRESTLLKVINQRQLDRVAGQLRRWVLAGGKAYPGLKVRREREIALFYEGLPEPRPAPTIVPEDMSLLDVRPPGSIR